jgi:flagellar biosynthetic protein FliP
MSINPQHAVPAIRVAVSARSARSTRRRAAIDRRTTVDGRTIDASMLLRSLVAALAISFVVLGAAASVGAQPPQPPPIPAPDVPAPPTIGTPSDPAAEDTADDITIGIDAPGGEPSQSILLIIGLSLLSLAPSLVIMLTSFTRIVVVLSLTRNALGLQGVPPNQVIVGLALFLSLFVMAPTLQNINDDALQPWLDGSIDQGEAYDRATGPMQEFMLANTRSAELELMMDATPGGRPESVDDVGMTTVIPAFVLSELKTAFLMGFVIFIPFLIIDLVVASVLMSLGMMMLPPVFVSLPFKLLLFVLVGGWSLIIEALLASYL